MSQKGTFCHHLLTLVWFQTCVSSFLLLNTKEDILKSISKLTTPIDFHTRKKIGAVNFLVTNILQNIFFCVQQKK